MTTGAIVVGRQRNLFGKGSSCDYQAKHDGKAASQLFLQVPSLKVFASLARVGEGVDGDSTHEDKQTIPIKRRL